MSAAASTTNNENEAEAAVGTPTLLELPSRGSLEDISVQSGVDPSAKSQKLKSSKKLYFIVSIALYGAMCFLAFGIDFTIWIIICFSNMKYFIRPSGSSPFFSVVPDSYWLIIKFLIGALIHFLLSVFTILVLVGIRRTEQFVVKYQERLLLWVTATACVAEYFMFAGSIEYFGGHEVITNGAYADTVRPPYPAPEGCSSLRKLAPTSDSSVQHIRINLKWLVSVSCQDWELYVPQNGDGVPEECINYRKEVQYLRDRDCGKGWILSTVVYTMLSLNCLGIVFCCGVFYLYFRAIVRTAPVVRFSFLESTYQNDMDALKQVADQVKKYASVNEETHLDSPGPALANPPSSHSGGNKGNRRKSGDAKSSSSRNAPKKSQPR